MLYVQRIIEIDILDLINLMKNRTVTINFIIFSIMSTLKTLFIIYYLFGILPDVCVGISFILFPSKCGF